MSAQKIPFTFGVELEFALAYISISEPEVDRAETRKVRFEILEEDHDNRDKEIVNDQEALTEVSVKRHIRLLLQQAGLPVHMDHVTPYGDFTKWDVATDSSVQGPEESEYDWIPIEIRSPAYEFTQAHLDAVQQVCDLLTTNYLTDTGDTTGLHVHVGRGNNSFEHQQIRNLCAFHYAFEPQLHTALGLTRSSSPYALPSRDSSRYAQKYYQKYMKRPSPIDGVRFFLESNEFRTDPTARQGPIFSNVTGWLSQQNSAYADDQKFSAINLAGVVDRAANPTEQTRKPTVEWRAHEGTLEGLRVTNWITAVVGIMDYVCYAYPQDLYHLLMVSAQETWQKTGNQDLDAALERELGPTLADRDFTLVDLFNYMGLHQSAQYYSDKLVNIKKFEDRFTAIGWFRWAHDSDTKLSDEQRKDLDGRKEIFHAMRRLHLDETTSIRFDPEDPFWPEFSMRPEGRDMDRDTDLSV